MSAKHSTSGKPLRAAVYIRMSSLDQDASPERQRSDVTPYSERKGYAVVAEYEDLGIAGDEFAKRVGLQRMLADAKAGKFDVIVCDEPSRLSRQDVVDFIATVVKPLREAGVRLDTVSAGPVGWDDLAQILMLTIHQDKASGETKALSRRVLAGMLLRAKEGRWLGGVAPYGYTLVPDELLGKKLVPGDPEKVRAVKLMFTLYDQGYSLNAIAGRLSESGLLNPRGTDCWNQSTVRNILACRKYVGDGVWNAGHDGKFSELKAGAVTTSGVRLKVRTKNPAEDWVIVPDTHEPLIDRDLWERVQARLAGNRTYAFRFGKTKVYPLAGLLVCGHCGWKMIGSSGPLGKHYKCGRYHQMGKHGCNTNSLSERKLVRGVVGKLESVLLNPAVLKVVRKDFRQKAEEMASSNAPKLNQARKQIADLEGKISQGMERMAVIPADLLTEYAAKVRGWKEERDRLRRDVEALEKAAPVKELNKLLEGFDEAVTELKEIIRSGDATRLRAVLVEWVSRAELYFDHKQTPKMVRSIFREGRLYVRPQHGFDLSCLLSDAANPTPAAPGASG
jgi:site-specific DNA recombinase